MTNCFLKKGKFSVVSIIFISVLIFSTVSYAKVGIRQEINIPDILGYKTLKCDFHMHTVFSDGSVWPPIRVVEAWQEGLDVISITDHIEQYHKKEIPINHKQVNHSGI